MTPAARILIVDDEENIRFTMERILTRESFLVRTVPDYEKALDVIENEDIDIVFADIRLKGRGGVALLEEVRNRRPNCPVILFTADPRVETAAEAVRLGAFDYVPKPLRRDAMLRIVKAAMRHKTLVAEKEKYRLNLEAIFRSVRETIILVDTDLMVVESNCRERDICGLSRENAVGRPFREHAALCAGACLEPIREAVTKNDTVDIPRLECGRRDRPEQVVGVTISPLHSPDRAVSGSVIVIRDETRVARLEENLNQRRRFHGIVGKSPRMREIYSLIETLADVDTTVLITGESGTGKEVVADAIHFTGRRGAGPLIKVNCSALSESLLESELFGHTAGAFTGAVRDKAGRFQKADGGTLFLDEIGDMSPAVQLRLLRFLQNREFERVGDSTPIRVDVRVLGATNRNLKEEIRAGRFREDLYYRLKVVEIHLPPLVERREDIPLLTEHFIDQFVRSFKRPVTSVSREAETILMRHSWPGNVRELSHAIEHAFVLCPGKTILPEHLPEELRAAKSSRGEEDYRRILDDALTEARWNKTEAARILGISRQHLYRKLKEYGMDD